MEDVKQDVVKDCQKILKTNNTSLISSIPDNFDSMGLIYNRVPTKLKLLLQIDNKSKNMTYLEFRAIMVKYLKNNNLLTSNCIKLKEPFLYNGKDSICMEYINEWVYGLLIEHVSESKLKIVVKKNKIFSDDDTSTHSNSSRNKRRRRRIPVCEKSKKSSKIKKIKSELKTNSMLVSF